MPFSTLSHSQIRVVLSYMFHQENGSLEASTLPAISLSFWRKDPHNWEVIEPLPSYGRGTEIPGGRYQSLINGHNLHDVVITGNNGTIDGMGLVWWEWFSSHSLNYSRPHLVELVASNYVVVSNLSFLNAPAYTIHPVYCSNVNIQNISISAPPESPYTVGIVPDSSDGVCIEDCIISMGYDAIALKSGWDEYGIAYGRPTKNVHIRRVYLRASSGSTLAFGSDMSGGISNVLVEHLNLHNSLSGIEFRTTRGRGGYIKEIVISDVKMENVYTAFAAIGHCGSHPDDKFDPNALPLLDHITMVDVIGRNITIAGSFYGIPESPFTNICLSNITLSINPVPSSSWDCSNVSGFSHSVLPMPCPDLLKPLNSSSSSCSPLLRINGETAVL
ncbi:putative polygalacturonase isoform X2 [Senna tora]|uniref:Putative polygalacturonase isoform X2 n=1 Tax=Senna tora TaxID=362788 RepID=A0A835CC79_9FABA|nr:putative polygalacturonase isoform X2 [Senna tora]